MYTLEAACMYIRRSVVPSQLFYASLACHIFHVDQLSGKENQHDISGKINKTYADIMRSYSVQRNKMNRFSSNRNNSKKAMLYKSNTFMT